MSSCAKPLFLTVSLLLFLVTATALHTQPSSAQTWRVEPGIGYGPVRLGMSPDEVLGILGSPRERKDPSRWATTLTYSTSEYWFVARNVNEDPPVKELFLITVWDRNATTRGGIRIGSTLFQVIDVFGDTRANLQTAADRRVLSCMDVLIHQAERAGPNQLTLTVSYQQLGISFRFSVSNVAPRPILSDMQVGRVGKCIRVGGD